MGLDSIVFYGTAAAAQAALAPTSAVIKGTTGDAFIVGYNILGGTDNTYVDLTCPGDPRWEAAGLRLTPGNADAAQAGCPYVPHWFVKKIPIKEGATLVATQTGADDCYCIVYVDYREFGEPFEVRKPSDGAAFMVTKTLTAGAALTAFTITANSTNNATFQRGKSYTPIYVSANAAWTTPPIVGIQNTKFNLATYWVVPLTPIVNGTLNMVPLPKGLAWVDGGETAFFHFLSTTAEAPSVNVAYAYV